MPRTQTKEQINHRLLSKKVTVVGEYINTQTKTTFRCDKDHEWVTTPNSLLSTGTGCPECQRLSMFLTPEKINLKLGARGIEMVGKYLGTNLKSTFRCAEGHEWIAKVNSVLTGGNGCPYCSNHAPLTVASINERLKNRHIKLVGDFAHSKLKTLFECDNNHQFMTRPNDMLNGHGCPYCALHGFRRALPGYGYIIEYNDYIKYGISNNADSRMKMLESNGVFRVVQIEYFENGSDAWDWERTVKTSLGGRYVDSSVCRDGHTETLHPSKLPQLLETLAIFAQKSQPMTTRDFVTIDDLELKCTQNDK